MSHDPERRKALKTLFFGALATTRLARAGDEPGRSSSAVFRARRGKLVNATGKVDPALLEAAVGAAVAGALGESSATDGFKKVFRPSDVVGIKVNCIAGKGFSPRPELVRVLVQRLQDAGVPTRNILVWDRTDRELKRAGFEITARPPASGCSGPTTTTTGSPASGGRTDRASRGS